MAPQNGYSAYNNNKVLTASPAELILMLYDGCIKFCNIAKVAIENKDYAKANTNLQKAQRIVAELRVNLDMRYEVAKDFDNVYEYIGWVLLKANVKKDVDRIDEALKHLRTMRDTWKEVMQLSKTQAS